jgi:hypothetical protein
LKGVFKNRVNLQEKARVWTIKMGEETACFSLGEAQ